MDFALRPVSFEALPGWTEDDPTPVIRALRRCHHQVTAVKPHRTGSLGIASADLLPAFEAALGSAPSDPAEARRFFEARFQPFAIQPGESQSGFVTAFYEPIVPVSATADAVFRIPFYARPDDLVDLDETNRPASLDGSFAFGRRTENGILEYADRQAIEKGFLAGRGLEIAYARSKEDVFFAHVQGAARLVYPNGKMTRITYAAKTGHPFTAIGKLLIERGEISRDTVSMQSIRAWLEANPERADEVYWHNRSFIFFREAPVEDPCLGPIAAAKVALEPGRSLAVDRLIHTFGTPFFIASDSLTSIGGGKPFRRLMLALDTGSAIVGPARGDIFTGSGEEAGRLAGAVRDAAAFFILIPKSVAPRYG